MQGTQNSWNNLKKEEQSWVLKLSNFKIYYTSIGINI